MKSSKVQVIPSGTSEQKKHVWQGDENGFRSIIPEIEEPRSAKAWDRCISASENDANEVALEERQLHDNEPSNPESKTEHAAGSSQLEQPTGALSQGALFLKHNILSVIILYSLFSVPLTAIADIKLFNSGFWMFAANIAFEVPAMMSHQAVLMAIILRILERSSDTQNTRKRLSFWFFSVCLTFWVGMICILSFMLSVGIFPVPFYGTLLGSLSVMVMSPTLMGLYIYLIIPGLDKHEIMKGCILFIKIWFGLFSVTMTEVPFLLGIYMSLPRTQMLIVCAFQLYVTLAKFLTRLYIKRSMVHSGENKQNVSGCLLIMNYFFEFLLQFFISIVSPRMIGSSALITYLVLESLSLAMIPLLDSNRARNLMKALAKRIAPSKSQVIDRLLTVHTDEERMFSMTNCAMNFFVRLNSSLCSIFFGFYLYYGYNRGEFVTSKDLGRLEFRGSIFFSFGSGVIAVIQYIITRMILSRVYTFDMHQLWLQALHENFLGFLSVPPGVFVHVAASILTVYYSMSYVLSVS